MNPRLRITRVRAHFLEAPLSQRFGWSLNWTSTRSATLVEVETDAGLTGWGDGGFGGDRLRANPDLVIGRSPFEAEAIYDDLRPPARHQDERGESLSSAGLDAALWDLMGQAVGKPISALLGRRLHDRVPVYCTCMYRKDWPDLTQGLVEEALSWIARGHRIIKMKIGYGPEIDVRIVRVVREAIGDAMGLAVDSNCAYDAATAISLGKRLEPFGLLWWEEPLWAADLAGYDRLRRMVNIPLASGETLGADRNLRDYVTPRRVHIVQPDMDTVGFTGGRRITEMCALNGVRLIAHNWGTHIRTAAELHWMACCPEIAGHPPMFEFDQTENPLRQTVVRETIAYCPADGRIPVPNGPGLGVQVVREAVDEFRRELITVC